MLPTQVSSRTALLYKNEVTLPALCQGASFVSKEPCARIVCRGGHTIEAPTYAAIPLPADRVSVSGVAPGISLVAPVRCPLPSAQPIPYDYTAADNKGNKHRFQGAEIIDPDRAELLGWLVGDGSLGSPSQSIRFASSDVWCLKRVEQLVQSCFPAVRVGWYAKNGGYDITLTGGISNPLRHFLRCMRLAEGFPFAVNLFDHACRIAFLRGLWGADGWCYVRKGGNDVDLGLSVTDNHAYSSVLRMFHAVTLGMNGHIRSTATRANPDAHRIIFSGYPNYRTFFNEVGQIRSLKLPAPPVARPMPVQPTVIRDAHGYWGSVVVQRVTRTTPIDVYRLP